MNPEKVNTTEVTRFEATPRYRFIELIAGNPNYFGTLKESEFQPVLKLSNDVFYEQISCVGYNPYTERLEAVIQVKQATGYNGSLCQNGSYEYVRFFVDYGSGYEDSGVAAANVHDIPEANDCQNDLEKPLSYAVSVQLSPVARPCFAPLLPKVRAILSWNSVPTANDPSFVPVWGHAFEAEIQIRPRTVFFSEVVREISEEAKLALPKEQLQEVLHTPIPLPDPAPLDLVELRNLYTSKPVQQVTPQLFTAVPPHRFGFVQAYQALNAAAGDASSIANKIAVWTKAELDWQAASSQVLQTKLDVSYEQLECLALEGGYGLERLVATLRIKRAAGYSGGLCTAGSVEYVAFWADWDDTCTYTYLGTAQLGVHDIASIPAVGLVYSVALPVDLSGHREGCSDPKIARVRAVLSWAVPPSTTNPNAQTTWGNHVDAHVQVQPGVAGNPLSPTISILGGIPVSGIQSGNGLTTPDAVFAQTGLPADSRTCPFGGLVSIQGQPFVGYRYRITVRPFAGGTPQPVITPLSLVRFDGTTYTSAPDAAGFFPYVDQLQNIDAVLGEWNSAGDDLWQVTLEIADSADNLIAGALPDTHLIQLDNTYPQAQINLDSGGDCGRFTVGAMLDGHFVAYDANFGSFSLTTEPFPGPVSPSGGSTPTAALPSMGNAWTLDTTTLVPCGYVVQLTVSDRSIVNSAPGSNHTVTASAGFCLLEAM